MLYIPHKQMISAKNGVMSLSKAALIVDIESSTAELTLAKENKNSYGGH